MQPEAFLANAERVLMSFGNDGRDCDDCGARCVIHAAYYAVFHHVAKSLNVPVTGEGYSKHGDIWHLLKARGGESPSLHVSKRIFQSLRDLRQRADYNLNDRLGFAEASDAIDFAYEVFSATALNVVVS